jgi:type VI secretion system secreted protein Hcp
MIMKKTYTVLILLAAAVATAGAQDAISIKLDPGSASVPGCTTRLGAGTFAVQSWSFGASDPVSILSSGAGGQTTRSTLSNLVIIKQLDECSTQLFGLALQDYKLPKLVLTQTDASGKTTLMTVELDDAIVSNYQLAGSTTSAAPAETVSFAISKIQVTYYGAGAALKFGWDVTQNKRY